MSINELLGTKYPIFRGATVNIATSEFATAVSNCGALGVIAADVVDKHRTREAIHTCKQLTDKPFGVSVMSMNPYTQAIAQVICEEQIAVITTSAGNPGPYIPALRGSGCKVIPIVASVALTRRLEKSEVDAVIAEDGESGGHAGEVTTMSLVPQVVDAVSIPVLAAGGIASGRQLNTVPCLGAVGMQVGACLLLAEECPTYENYRKTVMKARNVDPVVTGRSTGTPVHVLKNQMAPQYLKLEQSGAGREEMEKLTLGGLRRAVHEGDMSHDSITMGQAAGMYKDIRPLQKILDSLIHESEEETVTPQQTVEELYYE